MNKGKLIIRTGVAIALVITMLFSLSSCIIDFEFYSDLLDGYLGNDNDNDNGNGGENQNPDNGGSGNDSSGGGSIGEFYPGSGEGEIDNIPTLQQTLLSTVIIVANFSYTPSAGSGVIYQIDKESGDAYIITNYHVVYSDLYGLSSNIKLYLYGMELEGYAISAKFIGGSVNYDIAVLKVEGSEVLKNSYAKAAELADSESIRVFDTVYTVGNPEGYGFSVCKGILSVESENLDMEGADGSSISLRVMRFDAAVNGGNSGGGLYDSNGRLAGIVCAKRVGSDIDNIGYAIPSNLAKNLADNIIYHCNGSTVTKLNRALMGVTITSYVSGLVIDPDTGSAVKAEKVEVIEVSSGSLAEGKVKAGDVIKSIAVDGVTVEATRLHHVTDHMLNARVGSTITLSIDRGGEMLSVSFTVTSANITLEK